MPPVASSAWSATYGSLVCTAIVVSKPCFTTVVSAVSVVGEDPESTRQEATAVAPFQLAASDRLPAPTRRATSAGALVGCPLHAKSSGLKLCTSLPNLERLPPRRQRMRPLAMSTSYRPHVLRADSSTSPSLPGSAEFMCTKSHG